MKKATFPKQMTERGQKWAGVPVVKTIIIRESGNKVFKPSKEIPCAGWWLSFLEENGFFRRMIQGRIVGTTTVLWENNEAQRFRTDFGAEMEDIEG
jgi:hypothetical protein